MASSRHPLRTWASHFSSGSGFGFRLSSAIYFVLLCIVLYHIPCQALLRIFEDWPRGQSNNAGTGNRRIIRTAMPITKYEGRTLTQQTFKLEESWFVNCVL